VLRLRAQLVVDVEAANFLEAAEHQARLERLVAELAQAYPQASLTIRERREPRLKPQKTPERPRRSNVVIEYASRRRAPS
jgi:hypothetical protein